MTLYRMIAVPLFLLAALMLSPFNRKIRRTLGLRLRSVDWPAWIGQVPTLWVHCSSGEFEYARPVIREWRKLRPQGKVFVSYYSPSYQRFIEQSPEVDASAPLPLDLAAPMAEFIKRIKPEVLAVSRTDLWPEMCVQARRRKVPIVLFSATRAESWSKSVIQSVARWQLNMTDQVLAVSSEDKDNFSRLKLKVPVEIFGDSRYDQVLFRLAHPRPVKMELHPQDSTPVLVAGSTWPADEAVLAKALSELLPSLRLRLIIAPHECDPSHIKNIEALFRSQGIETQRYSSADSWRTPVLIVDQVGVLAELYQWGDLAFVGGSFRSSVHSVMEPLAGGSLTFVGPYHKNNREALEFKTLHLDSEFHMVEVVKDSRDLSLRLEAALKNRNRKTWPERIGLAVRNRSGASQAIAKRLIELVGQRPLRASDQKDIPSSPLPI